MLFGIIVLVIDSQHQSDIGIFAGGSDQHPPGAGVNMLHGAVVATKLAAALKHKVDIQLLPGQFIRLATLIEGKARIGN